MRLEYRILVSGAEAIEGSAELSAGELHLRPLLPEGSIESVKARVKVDIVPTEKIFMNGYQTWTYCPEYTRSDKISDLKHLPTLGIDHVGLDRYGDHHFVDYPNKPGFTHGFSYCYFRDGERFRLLASLDEKPGYTMFLYNANEQLLTIERDCAGLCCGGEYPAFDLFYAEGGEDEVFDAWFAAMGIKPITNERIAGYSSWYNRYQAISEQSIAQDLEGSATMLKAGDLFQIDDGWEPFVGDWLVPDAVKFPGGMKAQADAIHAKGFKAGLWLAPFVCQVGSDIYENHKDWLYLHEGQPWFCGNNWGGFYALDIDKPQVVDYIERCFRQVFDDWGFDLVKLDFLYAAAPFGSDRETRAGRMIRAMELLRRVCGDKLILGCGVPVMPAFGLVDYCRISCDVGLDWDGSEIDRLTHRERVSTRQAIGNTVFRRQLNGRAYLSDPDVFFLREENLMLTMEEKYALATVNSLFGGVLFHSDDMSLYTEEAKAIYRGLLKNYGAKNVKVHADEGIAVSYELDGKEIYLKLE